MTPRVKLILTIPYLPYSITRKVSVVPHLATEKNQSFPNTYSKMPNKTLDLTPISVHITIY